MSIIDEGITFEEARQRFENDLTLLRKLRTSFDHLYRRFQNPHNTMVSLAHHLGVSRFYLAKVYELYFAPFLGTPYATVRAKRLQDKRKKAKNKVIEVKFRNVILRGKEYGMVLQPYDACALRCNGALCAVRLIHKPVEIFGQKYASFDAVPSIVNTHHFFIIAVDIGGTTQRYFVVPSSAFKETGARCEERRINIPLEKKPPKDWRRGRAPLIDLLPYEDAWHLLG